MMNTLLTIVLGAFAIGAGLFIGTGSYHGVKGVLIPAFILACILAIPFLRDQAWFGAGVMIVCCLIGAVIATQVPDANSLKQFCRNQSNLHIKIFSYELGRDPDAGKPPSNRDDE
jgi:hypothetical protein